MAGHEADPQQRIAVRAFERFVAYFVAHSYAFVAPAGMLRGPGPAGKYALLTFGDGCGTDRLALNILRRWGVPRACYC
ncbi:hypothetical protein [Hymenobacter coccineus]|uniref:Uncharacterized protein n=1 Tax=Hymenobacter coccineus TaxID=1908235 RepID=A0A1G1THE9_9BACT|nr:hypothetical protein [Hymenobacter coccineus]OGX90301.1 hypothetical protein BEN49_07005 [Hymenobacter coccineus]